MILSTASSHFTAEPIQPQRWLYPRTATKVALGLATIRTIRIAFQWRQELVQDSYLHSGNLQDAQPVLSGQGMLRMLWSRSCQGGETSNRQGAGEAKTTPMGRGTY